MARFDPLTPVKSIFDPDRARRILQGAVYLFLVLVEPGGSWCIGHSRQCSPGAKPIGNGSYNILIDVGTVQCTCFERGQNVYRTLHIGIVKPIKKVIFQVIIGGGGDSAMSRM